MKCELHDDARKDLNDDLFRFDHSKLHENIITVDDNCTSAVSYHLKRDLVWETKAVAENFTFYFFLASLDH